MKYNWRDNPFIFPYIIKFYAWQHSYKGLQRNYCNSFAAGVQILSTNIKLAVYVLQKTNS